MSGGAWILVVLSLALYLIPTFLAWAREHRQTAAIVALNILAGWTLIGWIVALVWAMTASEARPTLAPPLLGKPDLAGELARYGALLDQGILTQDEFDAIKTRLLQQYRR